MTLQRTDPGQVTGQPTGTLDPIPLNEPWSQDAQGKPLYVTGRWLTWLYNSLTSRLGSTSYRLASPVRLFNQSASIGATPVNTPQLTAGQVRVSWYARITTADTTGESLTVNIGWIETGLSLQTSGPAMTGTTTSANQEGSVMLEVDGGTQITYGTTWVSNAGVGQYRLTIKVESLP